jgi:hypothetical protein
MAVLILGSAERQLIELLRSSEPDKLHLTIDRSSLGGWELRCRLRLGTRMIEPCSVLIGALVQPLPKHGRNWSASNNPFIHQMRQHRLASSCSSLGGGLLHPT